MDAKEFMLSTTRCVGKISTLGGAEGVETILDTVKEAEVQVVVGRRTLPVGRVSVKTDHPLALRIETEQPSLASRALVLAPLVGLACLLSSGLTASIIAALGGIQ